MKASTIAIVAGAGIAAEVARRHFARKKDQIPAQVSSAASRVLASMRIDPCGGVAGGATDFTDYFVRQKAALSARFGSAMAFACGPEGLGICLPSPSKSIPTASTECTLAVIGEWQRAARTLAANAETVGSLRGDLTELAGALDRFVEVIRLRVKVGGGVDSDTNRRVWSVIARLHIALAGTHIHHGDAEREARAELADTLTSPDAYIEVVADVGGFVLGGVAKVAGAGAASFLASNAGAIALVAGAGFLIWKGRTLL
jgi:hypothetical protein